MFEKASRLKIRYYTTRGILSVEDLWDVPLSSNDGFSLDDIAKRLNRELKQSEEESFVEKNTKNETAELAFNIVKRVIEVKLAEAAEANKKAANKQRNQKILAIIEKKQDAALEEKDIDSLKAMLEE